ncbi:MAG: peptide ABC transporter substrate-binding protein [Vicinamibacterales bacterium]|jgi:peptide/nickel transport system substrate-binding protein|nr:hypothetical protein [Acidobacteriota bacterium]MDP6371169.1 peptide ABC transporter substrate-binding protein [Vicinamibacterales bacterium]MDP6607685.1 peptide ABC transporter substrate-binding protein [Vicinamibacterales bacterium]HAK54164.1 hypothetical protein [Acidobacteriota bacterium]
MTSSAARRSLVLIAACIVGAIIVAGSACTEVNPRRLDIGWSESPQAGLNPFLARNEGDYLFLGLIYEPLCMPMMDGSVEPWIAESWEFDADRNAWLFHLDERAHWSDGTPLTADDVVFTFETVYAGDFPMGSTTKAFVKSVEAIDAQTVRFAMNGGFAGALPLLGGTLIMPRHVWADVDDVAQHPNETPVGSGPFVLEEFQPRSFLHVVRDADYWRGPARIDEVVIRVFLNLEAEVVALMKGELDLMPDLSGSEALIPPLEEDANVEVLLDRWPHIFYLAPNHRVDPWGQKAFRQAVDLALDKQAILDVSLAGYAEMPLMGYVPPLVTRWANPSVEWRGAGMTETERLAAANGLLDDLGLTRDDAGLRRTADGEPLAFTVSSLTYPSYIRAAELAKESLAKVGIELTVQVSDPETLYGGIVFSGERPLDWQLLVHGSTLHPDPDHFAREFAPVPPNPWDNAVAFGWEHEGLQSLLRDSRTEMDDARRRQMIQDAQTLFAEELPVITLGHRLHPAAHRTDTFTGWNPAKVIYGGMVHPLGSIVNLLSLEPI